MGPQGIEPWTDGLKVASPRRKPERFQRLDKGCSPGSTPGKQPDLEHALAPYARQANDDSQRTHAMRNLDARHPALRRAAEEDPAQRRAGPRLSVASARSVYQVEQGREGHHYGRETVLRISNLYADAMRDLGITVEDLLRGTECNAGGEPRDARTESA